MFTAAQIEVFTNHLHELKNDLLLNKRETADEAWWPTPYYINPDEYDFQESYDIFNGNCGIALFFLELYRFDQSEAHISLIDKMMNRMMKSEAILKPKFFAFYTGLGGVIYTNLKIYEATGIQKYLDNALFLTLSNHTQLSAQLLKADLLSGYTGNLLVFTLLYHHSQNGEVLQLIHLLLDRLIQEARVSGSGLKWDYHQSKKAYDSMTGFSHGASGIAYCLMQLSMYFDEPGLLYLAEEALAYEMQYYHAPANNWLDLRIGNYELSKPGAHLWQLETFISDMAGANAWAHGAAGVGLSRSLAFKLTQKELYSKQCNCILEKCLSDLQNKPRPDFTLVSGYSGMIPFLMCNNDREGIADHICDMIEGAITQYRKTNSYNEYLSCGPDDYGLFSGKAGVGYVLLQLIAGDQSDSVAKPTLPKPAKIINLERRFSMVDIKRKIFSSYFKRTIGKLDLLGIRIGALYEVKNIDEFSDVLAVRISQMAGVHESIAQSFRLESALLKLWKLHKGYFSYQQQNIHLKKNAESASQKSDSDFIALTLKLNDHVRYFGEDENGNMLLLYSHESGVEEIKIGTFSAIIVESLVNRKMKTSQLIDEITHGYFKPTTEKEQISQKIVLQIRLLLKSGFLCVEE
ncbi:Lanthionine synthetase C-like protein [Pedobacter terrae]|uniref:Lanthionine synthetase C-like protein n=1 Tax=Pedobacter terrae TaxID=405671 RepID=A0A1G7NH98_9SPHI|nr:lanthionine synthetase LanC family protein [Pedobacter terrae]SDF73444.1 Lanthionine synthetase C-like protein [Pedobacter terrae]